MAESKIYCQLEISTLLNMNISNFSCSLTKTFFVIKVLFREKGAFFCKKFANISLMNLRHGDGIRLEMKILSPINIAVFFKSLMTEKDFLVTLKKYLP